MRLDHYVEIPPKLEVGDQGCEIMSGWGRPGFEARVYGADIVLFSGLYPRFVAVLRAGCVEEPGNTVIKCLGMRLQYYWLLLL